MHETQQICLSRFTGSLVGYATYNHSIVYVTPESITINSVHCAPQTAAINGSSVLNFAISTRSEVAILYKQRYIEIRRMDRLRQVIRKIENINITQAQDYPLLKILNQELYLVYPSAVEIISLKDGSRSKYTDLVTEPEYHKIYDLHLLNLIESLCIGLLQLRNRLIVAIIPCTITEMHIQGLSQVICLHPNIATMHPKTTYLAVLAEQLLVKIFDLISLKQICEIELPAIDAFIEIEADPQSSYILAHYINKETGKPMHNFVYKINDAFFYDESRNESECQQFISYYFQVKNHEYLSPLSFHREESLHTFTLYYFKDQSLLLQVIHIEKPEKQSQEEIQSITDIDFWQENSEWRDIISTYMQLQQQSFKQSGKKFIYSEQERQLQEYYEITKDFDRIVQQFSQILSEKSRKYNLSQRQVEEEWESYLQKIARERNFMRQTMSLFKIDYKIVKQPHQERNLIGIELENCIKDLQGRESRVDARIRQKKMQLEEQQLRKEKEKAQAVSKLSEAEIKKEQEEYNKFVTEYLAEIERKQAEQIASKAKAKERPAQTQEMNPQLILRLPQLNEQERKIIQHKSLDLSHLSSLSSQKEEVNPAWQQFLAILSQVQQDVSPLERELQRLIDKIDRIQHSSLQEITRNQMRLQSEMSIDLQAEVKNSCRGMLSRLKGQIKSQMDSAMQKLYKMEEKAIRQNQQTIQKFKEFAKLQVRHRVEIYHRSRRQLELTAHNIAKSQAQQVNKTSL